MEDGKRLPARLGSAKPRQAGKAGMMGNGVFHCR